MENYNQAIQKALQLARTPEGQQMIAMLRQLGGQELDSAIEKAGNGDYRQAKQLLTQIMENPEAKKLLDNMGR